MDNLYIYNKARVVPKEAQRTILAGRLKGKTDINPMWRLKLLTELFGMCGIGWKYEITKQWLEQGGNNEVAAFVNINLYVRVEGEWSEAIPGTGGSSFVANEKNGPYVSDECFKMALTDAISVSCKFLGFGADVYWDKDNTKYMNQDLHQNNIQTTNIDKTSKPTDKPSGDKNNFKPACAECNKEISIAEHDYSAKKYGKPLCRACQNKVKKVS